MRRRRIGGVVLIAAAMAAWWLFGVAPMIMQTTPTGESSNGSTAETTKEASRPQSALAILETLAVKGRAPKTGYARLEFGDGWAISEGCDMRNIILNRDLSGVVVSNTCKIQSGVLTDPYTGKTIQFKRGAGTSSSVQIDHVVALSNAWQTGAQLLDKQTRIALANDPLELLAVDGRANQAKGDSDAATWLPSHKPFRCQYVARQVAVKAKYNLWVTPAEKSAMQHVLAQCPDETIPTAHQ